MNRKQAFIFQMTRSCPKVGGNPKECPLHPVRVMSEEERREFVLSLTPEEIEVIYQYHYHECPHNRT
jgi:hypothetical protein